MSFFVYSVMQGFKVSRFQPLLLSFNYTGKQVFFAFVISQEVALHRQAIEQN